MVPDPCERILDFFGAHGGYERMNVVGALGDEANSLTVALEGFFDQVDVD